MDNKKFKRMKNRILLTPLLGLSILAGCKEDDFKDLVREDFGYYIEIDYQQSTSNTVEFKTGYTNPFELSGDVHYKGIAADFILSHTSEKKDRMDGKFRTIYVEGKGSCIWSADITREQNISTHRDSTYCRFE